MDLSFYKNKKVLITGHTGFKGTWLTKILVDAGAEVTGYSVGYPTDPCLIMYTNLEKQINNVIGDIRDYDLLRSVFEKYNPEIVFHLAAQPIVREGYANPRYTYETNVMGTVNLLECVRNFSCVKSVVNVTTDKVYQNNEWDWGYRENDRLNGYDPYSNSKSCSELVTDSYKKSFWGERNIAVSTVRAGNVIGGGDFAKDRIVPDCIRAVTKGEEIVVRNPNSIRPYQHVLEPLMVYLEIAARQYQNVALAGSYNVGPDDNNCVTTGTLVDIFCEIWGLGARWKCEKEANAPHEANYLKLDCSKLKNTFSWAPNWTVYKSIEAICQFTKIWLAEKDINLEMSREINDFLGAQR